MRRPSSLSYMSRHVVAPVMTEASSEREERMTASLALPVEGERKGGVGLKQDRSTRLRPRIHHLETGEADPGSGAKRDRGAARKHVMAPSKRSYSCLGEGSRTSSSQETKEQKIKQSHMKSHGARAFRYSLAPIAYGNLNKSPPTLPPCRLVLASLMQAKRENPPCCRYPASDEEG